jgi:hypothetical protein
VEKVIRSLKSGPGAKAFAPIVLIALGNIPGANFAYFRDWLFVEAAGSRVFGGW